MGILVFMLWVEKEKSTLEIEVLIEKQRAIFWWMRLETIHKRLRHTSILPPQSYGSDILG